VPGVTPDISLDGNNPITQYVFPSTMTIVNDTQKGREFYYGTVTLTVIPTGNNMSTLNIVGSGNNSSQWNAYANVAVGYAFFGSVGVLAQQTCLQMHSDPNAF